MAFDRLIQRIDELHNPSVAGLDHRLEYVQQYIGMPALSSMDTPWRQQQMRSFSSIRH